MSNKNAILVNVTPAETEGDPTKSVEGTSREDKGVLSTRQRVVREDLGR